LGVPGLIKAYGMAAEDALNNTEIIEKDVKLKFSIVFNYASMNEVLNFLKKIKADFLHKEFDTICKAQFLVNKTQKESVLNKFDTLLGVEIKLES